MKNWCDQQFTFYFGLPFLKVLSKRCFGCGYCHASDGEGGDVLYVGGGLVRLNLACVFRGFDSFWPTLCNGANFFPRGKPPIAGCLIFGLGKRPSPPPPANQYIQPDV